MYVFPPQSSSDKRFLVKQHATMLRQRNKHHWALSAVIEEDVMLSD